LIEEDSFRALVRESGFFSLLYLMAALKPRMLSPSPLPSSELLGTEGEKSNTNNQEQMRWFKTLLLTWHSL
jgi:hypothetical protein